MTERFTLTAMCGVHLNDRKTAMDFMLMLGLNETIDGYGKQCLLVLSCVVERGWSCLGMGSRL